MDKGTITQAGVADAPSIFNLINAAYSVEAGNDGVAFKNCHRLLTPLGDGLTEEMYENGFVLKAEDDEGKLQGVIVWKMVPSRIEQGRQDLYFGPFSVDSAIKGKGVGGALMRHVFKLAADAGAAGCEIWVINHRQDLFPMYSALGFAEIAEESYPLPERLTRPAHFVILRRSHLEWPNK